MAPTDGRVAIGLNGSGAAVAVPPVHYSVEQIVRSPLQLIYGPVLELLEVGRS